jgi:hypothetical protein
VALSVLFELINGFTRRDGAGIAGTEMFTFAPVRRIAFGISPDEATFDRRGFPAPQPEVRHHLEKAGGSFIEGYNTALADPRPDVLAERLNQLSDTYRGFAFEGAAMALALLDLVTPWQQGRFQAFCDGPGSGHMYLLYVGAGWAMARLPWTRRRFERVMRRFHPLYGWLTLDGYGFHQGYFYTPAYVHKQLEPSHLSGEARRVFDQGLGRSMWFSQGGDAERIAGAIGRFPARRQEALWSGVGLGSTYAGGVDRESLEAVRTQASGFVAHVAQGAAFAAKARQRAGNPVPHTALACEVYCRMTADQAAAVTDECLSDLPVDVPDSACRPDGSKPTYETWRKKIRDHFADHLQQVACGVRK